MPRITKDLPTDRADYSFGDLVYWHLFVFGTRPNIDPAAKIGRVWETEAICGLLGKSERTLRNWIRDKNHPDSITDLCQELFGNNPAWDEARAELQDRLAKDRAGKGRIQEPLSKVPPADEAAENSAEPGDEAGGQDAAKPENDPAEPEKSGNEENSDPSPRSEPQASRAVIERPPVMLRRVQSPPPVTDRRKLYTSLVAGLMLSFGIYGWVTSSRKSASPEPAPQAMPNPAPVPQREAQLPKPVEVRPPVTVAPPPPIAAPIPPPKPEAEPEVVLPPVPRIPTEAEKREAEERRLALAHIEARKEAHEREKRRLEELARQRDIDFEEGNADLRKREDDARQVAGMDYQLQEHRSIEGSPVANMLVGSVAECALQCTRTNCDAFAFYREQYGKASTRPRYCYLFKKPYRIGNSPGYVLGVRTAEPVPDVGRRHGAIAAETPIILAQATPPAAAPGDGVVRCATGPVKVTGFGIKCDTTLSGGTTLGSTRLSYTVRNINECAAKCRPVSKCVGFTFNAGDVEDQHACIIFGPTPEAREAAGWISGLR